MKAFVSTGKYIKAVRTGANLTQRDLAAMIGCSSQTISNAERFMACLPLSQVKIMKRKLPNFSADMFIGAFADDYAIKAKKRAEKVLKRS